MEWWFNSLWDLFPLPILIGMFIWTFSMCVFSLLLIVMLIFLQRRFVQLETSSLFLTKSERCSSSSPLAAELCTVKDLSHLDTTRKGKFSCDSLSVISCQTTANDVEHPVSSFYLLNSHCSKENERLHSLPSIKLRPKTEEDKQISTLPQSSTRRSIIRDLTSVSTSFNDKKAHQSIDSLFSKDSLIE